MKTNIYTLQHFPTYIQSWLLHSIRKHGVEVIRVARQHAPVSIKLKTTSMQSSFYNDHCQVAMHCGPEQPRIQTEVLGHSLVRSLAPLTHSLTPDYSLCSRPPLRSLVRSLAHFAHSLARGKVDDWMAIYSVFFFLIWPLVGWRRHVPMTGNPGAIVEGEDNVDVSLVLEEPIEAARPSFGLFPQPKDSVAKVEGCWVLFCTHRTKRTKRLFKDEIIEKLAKKL